MVAIVLLPVNTSAYLLGNELAVKLLVTAVESQLFIAKNALYFMAAVKVCLLAASVYTLSLLSTCMLKFCAFRLNPRICDTTFLGSNVCGLP